ncbi:hypothetical protein NDU88_010618 [Pleurodeles waltl]|uniref:Secreted protein n=1 Tax=Pleurodeles waltl TaxID=8319 RepID=A0AAV7R0Q9_PLEWA|nr:hypothetical protein NDU88_010618 [Pleurodeles waltl]
MHTMSNTALLLASTIVLPRLPPPSSTGPAGITRQSYQVHCHSGWNVPSCFTSTMPQRHRRLSAWSILRLPQQNVLESARSSNPGDGS